MEEMKAERRDKGVMVIYTESTRAGDWHKTWCCRAGQRAEKAPGVPLPMNAANLQCTLPLGTWRTQLPGWVSKSEERHPVAVGVQSGLLQLPSPRADCPENKAIPEHGVSGTPRWACANEGQGAGVMKSEIAVLAQMR